MTRRRSWWLARKLKVTRTVAFVGVALACACRAPREQPSSAQNAPAAAAALPAGAVPAAAPAAPNEPAVPAAYGVVPGRRTFDENNPEHYIREGGYPPGVFAVAMPDRPRLLAFDVESNAAAICTRIDERRFTLPQGGTYARFRCPGTWPSREVVFLDATEFAPTRGVQLEWTPLAGPSPLPRAGAAQTPDLHDYAAVARPGLLDGRWLVSAAWFSGEYPPREEPDELRGDSIAFGHYQLLDRTLFIGDSLKPSTVLYRASEPTEVREGIEWAFVPKNASEKTFATIAALYEIPHGYLVKVLMHHDHEGFGEDLSTYFYAWESGRWRLLAKADYTRLY